MKTQFLTFWKQEFIVDQTKSDLYAQKKFSEIFWGVIKIDALKGGRECKHNGNGYTIFSLSNVLKLKVIIINVK